MEVPDKCKTLVDVIKDCAASNMNDCDKATKEALKRINKLEAFKEFQSYLIYSAVKEIVEDFRHNHNRCMKNASGSYNTVEKTSSISSRIANKAALNSVFSFCINGRTLGDLLGEELSTIAQDQEVIASGYLFVAKLCRSLKPLVPNGKRVKEVVTEKKAQALFDKAKKLSSLK